MHLQRRQGTRPEHPLQRSVRGNNHFVSCGSHRDHVRSEIHQIKKEHQNWSSEDRQRQIYRNGRRRV